jgi:adenylosuccinate synthase
MPVNAIVGACWGDEGKGKMTDLLAREADFVVRYQGGRNAGHTIVNEQGRFALHLLPSGVFRPDVVNVLGPGVALDPWALVEELAMLSERGVPTPELRISDRAQVVLPHHVELDRLEEERLGDRSFGSTRVGIAPFYADKAAKLGIQVADLFDAERLRDRVEAALVSKNILLRELYGVAPVDPLDLVTALRKVATQLAPFVCDTTAMLHEGLASGANVLLEGQLGALRDPDHGVYPYTTSSSPLAGHGCVGAGLPPHAFERIVAVVKAYSSCVGATPFVTELDGEEAHQLRERGAEYGATTGRPRRVGYFDAVASRYGCRIQGATEVSLTLLDVLDEHDEIPICVAYRSRGKTSRDFPTCAQLAESAPVYEVHEGWRRDLSGVRRYADLPLAARRYVERIEALIETPIRWVSVGPERDAVIECHDRLAA